MLALLLNLITLYSVLLLIFFLLLTYYIINLPRMRGMPPGPFPLPIIGNFLQLGRRPPGNDFHIFQELTRKYGKIFTVRLGSHNMVVINDYDLLVEAYVKKSEACSDRPSELLYLVSYINKQFGTGIVTSNGPPWKQACRTSLMTMRDFGVGKQSLEERIHEEVRIMLDAIAQKNGEPFYTKPIFNLATSNVICSVIFGSRFDYEDEKFKELLRVMENSLQINPIFTAVNFFPYLKYIPFFLKVVDRCTETLATTTAYVKELTKDREETFDPDNIRDFVDLFIKHRKEHEGDEVYDNRQMLRVIVDLFTAGSDTTANTLAWATLLMAANPDIQKRCQKEIDEILGKSKQASSADRDKLPYVEATILEIMRYAPVAPFGLPHCTTRDMVVGGYNIPKDTIISSNIYAINQDPAVFKNPMNFDPTNFLDEDGKLCRKDRMLGFSVGPRSCIGEGLARQEVSLFFTSILQFFNISTEPNTPVDLKPEMALVLRHKIQNLILTRRE